MGSIKEMLKKYWYWVLAILGLAFLGGYAVGVQKKSIVIDMRYVDTNIYSANDDGDLSTLTKEERDALISYCSSDENFDMDF